MDTFVVAPQNYAVSIFEIGWLRRKEMRALLADAQERDPVLLWRESVSLCHSVFVVIGRPSDIYLLNTQLGITMQKPREIEKTLIAVLMVIIVISCWAFIAFAGDREHVGGAAAPSRDIGAWQEHNRQIMEDNYNNPRPSSLLQGLRELWDGLTRPTSTTPLHSPLGTGQRGAVCSGSCGDVGGGSWGRSMEGRGA